MRGAMTSLERCPYWCERPDGHGWEDGAAFGELMRVHRHTFPIPGTDHGSFMVLVTECLGRAGIEREPMSYVVDTGIGSDGELDPAGALGLAQVLAAALALETHNWAGRSTACLADWTSTTSTSDIDE
ncbi:hypothetical protein [Nocardia sp. NPDC050175]|uniref:hypothetical protein n=1 Tax=Nocardia sp. NPDC050175 TaxID=3364317 RepID=UPI003798CACB